MPVLYCIWALLMLVATPVAAQPAAQPSAQQPQPATAAPAARAYTVFLSGNPIGREEITTTIDATGTTIVGISRLTAPLNLAIRKVELKYAPDWMPLSMTLDASVGGADVLLRTAVANGTATSSGTNAGQPIAETTPILPQTLFLPNIFFGAHEATGRLLAARSTTGDFHAFIGPGLDVMFRVTDASTERMQTGTATFEVKRYTLLFSNATGELVVNLSTDERGGLIRLSVPAQGLDVIREDVATSTARTQIYSNPGDEAVMIPGAGFNLGATLTRPSGVAPAPAGATAAARLPAVILLSGSGVNDRDGFVAGIPTTGQLAGALADAGFLAVRYDKRGYGQSGGRAESATLSDFADDVRGVVKWLAARKDIDPKRIAVVGHSEGAMVALIAASREKRISAVVSIAGTSTTGAELTLEQQLHALDQLKTPQAERDEKIALQRKIQAAVLSGTGWDGVPLAMRQQADTPWFQSLLAYDPARVLRNVRQPILLVHGQLDRQVPVEHAERLSTIARTQSKSKAVEVVTVRGVNHLLVPAITGEVTEYSGLMDRNVSADVRTAITNWLTRTFSAIR